MSCYRRSNVAGGSYFFTVVTERRQRILTDDVFRLALREAIHQVRRERPFQIEAWVLLPDHLHTIWTLPVGDADFATRWRLIKSAVTRSVGEHYFRSTWQTRRREHKRCGTIWQHRYWEHLLKDEDDFRHHVDYVHFNPVKHGLVARACDWPYSTFHRLVAQGVYPEGWSGVSCD
ncbi:transposase [Chitinibacter sp. FCG-7]|uniref:Transposase n=1 Tax=Chitinibacter mangrovi TaxID=3153927 RepID=A0AAU7FDW0_9NEIS